jgi:hypothetical protein
LRSHFSEGHETLIASLALEEYFQNYALYCLVRIFEYAKNQNSARTRGSSSPPYYANFCMTPTSFSFSALCKHRQPIRERRLTRDITILGSQRTMVPKPRNSTEK